MPIRVPPPPASTLVEQWIIDTLLHLDTCVDETKKSNVAAFMAVKDETQDLRATIESWIVAGKEGHGSLARRIEDHQEFHDLMSRDANTKRSVWKLQGDWVKGAFRILTDAAVIGGAVMVLRALGVDL